MKNFKNHLIFFLFLLIYFSIVIFKIITNPLPFYDWDEAIYIQLSKEMIEKKSFIPLWQGKIWLDKPPLVIFLYAIIMKIFFFIQPEISTRLFNVFLNIIYLVLLYLFIIKITASKKIAFLTTMITSLTPLFIQRVFVINMDVFLGIGWVGYFIFYPHFFLSTFFLSLAIFSKSLLGFYPIFLMFGYYLFLFLIKKITIKKLLINFKILIWQIIIFSIWYLIMIFKFGKDFIYQHLFESHFKRVTASIEFHFGEKTFYIFELVKQFNFFSIFFIFGFLIILFSFIRKKINLTSFIYLNFFLPWFLFLNLTKTKIFWYLYPSIPQFSLYIAYFFKKLLNLTKFKKIKSILYTILILTISYWGFFHNNLLKAQYSSFDKFYYFSQFAKNNCQKIFFLTEKSHRQAISELERMNLTITTTKWWGGHPSLVYYTDNKINFFYDEKSFLNLINNKDKNDCFAYFKEENLNSIQNQVKLIKKFDDILLFK